MPFAAAHQGSSGTAYLTGALGVGVVILEGVQQLFQCHESWIRDRRTHQALTSEQQLFRAWAGDYAKNPAPVQLLATRVERLVANETGAWLGASTKPAEREPSK